ncbi:MAG: hypothetical protein MOGMAGMI_02106 [Candidatus Omnitrophica bacterium]|nr:hypothetical protein [Candidatus Omnitrophota bacterium]
MKTRILSCAVLSTLLILSCPPARAEGVPDDYLAGIVENYDGNSLTLLRSDEGAEQPVAVTVGVEPGRLLGEYAEELTALSAGDDVVIGHAESPTGPVLRSLVRLGRSGDDLPGEVAEAHREALLSVFRDNWMRAAAQCRRTVDHLRAAAAQAQDARGALVTEAAAELEQAALRLEKGQEASWRDVHRCYLKARRSLS